MIASAWSQLPAALIATFLIFCRIGTCLMLIPGYSSSRVPAQIRLYIALAVTVALAPSILADYASAPQTFPKLASLILSEAAIGGMIGFMGRAFMATFQFLSEAASMSIGLSTTSPSVDDGENLPAMATLLSLSAGVLIFISDLHWEVLRALSQSYSVVPMGDGFIIYRRFPDIVRILEQSSLLALQVCSPFLIFGIFFNFLFGLLGKLAPQIPVYFISPPFLLAGGFLLLYFTAGEILQIFETAFEAWLKSG